MFTEKINEIRLNDIIINFSIVGRKKFIIFFEKTIIHVLKKYYMHRILGVIL